MIGAVGAGGRGVRRRRVRGDATRAPNTRQAFLNDVAKRLNVTPAQLSAALKGALDGPARRRGQGRASSPRRRRTRSSSGSAAAARRSRSRSGRGSCGAASSCARRGPRTTLGAAAATSGSSDVQLLGDLRQRQTLAQIAKARGKSVSGLEQAITAAMKARLDQAVAAGRSPRPRRTRSSAGSPRGSASA